FLFSGLGEPVESFVRRVHDDALNTGVGLISGNAVLTTYPAVLESSPWRRRIDSVVGVDPHDPHVQLTREPVRSADITRPDTPGQAKWGRVGELDGMRFPVEWKDAGDRTKDFFLVDPHAGGYVRKNGGPNVIAMSQVSFSRALAAT